MKLTCVKCGLVWSVSSKHDKIGPYVCPRCDRREHSERCSARNEPQCGEWRAARKERYDKHDDRRDGRQDEHFVQ